MRRHARLIACLLLALPSACSDYDLKRGGDASGGGDTGEGAGGSGPQGTPDGAACSTDVWPAELVGEDDVCPGEVPSGGFDPIVEWSYGSSGGCLSLPAVGDLDGDGLPEVVVNVTDLWSSPGALTVLRGDGGSLVWTVPDAALGFAVSPAIGDLDGDGLPEVVGVREYNSSMFDGVGEYSVVVYDHRGELAWESEHFTNEDFDYAAAPVIADMDGDGSPEVIAGRVILNADGSTRGAGRNGRGSFGVTSLGSWTLGEGAFPAVVDLDLDGELEVVTGNARYDADGGLTWLDTTQEDAVIAAINLDDDPEGELVAVSFDTVRALDTDGSILWGPKQLPAGSYLSPPAIADLDGDGMVEIVLAGANRLQALNHDGSELWVAPVSDMSGATGASIFDFEGDGIPEVVYVDEQEVTVFDGRSGVVKFYSAEHSSNTMFDYPVIADVDADGHAEVVVCHNGYSSVLSVYGDRSDSWAPARPIWNQHAYSISNVLDDGSIPANPTQNFADSNTWHSAISTEGGPLSGADLQVEILDICLDDCDAGRVPVTLRVLNRSSEPQEAGLAVSLYAVGDAGVWLLGTAWTEEALDAGWASSGITLSVDAAALVGAQSLQAAVDDDGTGAGAVEECSEANNTYTFAGPFCE